MSITRYLINVVTFLVLDKASLPHLSRHFTFALHSDQEAVQNEMILTVRIKP